jgi:hypothetical protein
MGDAATRRHSEGPSELMAGLDREPVLALRVQLVTDLLQPFKLW